MSVGTMMRRLLVARNRVAAAAAARSCSSSLQPPHAPGASCTFSSAANRKPPPGGKPGKGPDAEPKIPDPAPAAKAPAASAPEAQAGGAAAAAAPPRSSSIGVIVGLAIVAAAGGFTWLTWDGRAPFKLNLPPNPLKQTIPDSDGGALRKARKEEARGLQEDRAEESERHAEGNADEAGLGKADEQEQEIVRQLEASIQETVRSVDELLRVAGEERDEVEGFALSEQMDEENRAEEDETAAGSGRPVEEAGAESGEAVQHQAEVPEGQVHEEESASIANPGVVEEHSENQNEVALESHVDRGDGVKGGSTGEDVSDSPRVELLDDSPLTPTIKDGLEKGGGTTNDGGNVTEPDTDSSREEELSDENADKPPRSYQDWGEGSWVSRRADDEKNDAALGQGGFSEEFLLQRAHQENVTSFLNRGEEGRPVPTTRDESREPSLQVEPDILVGAMHAAAQMQAEADSREFNRSLQKLREEHASELKDAHAKELMYAEAADRLQKEVIKEQRKAEERVRLLQQAAEERLKSELRRKDEETKRALEEAQKLAVLQAKASIAEERAAHIEELDGVKLQVDALRTAFYARSEEARKSHTAHKLSMGAFAFENAMRTGAPVAEEAILLIASAGGPGEDPVLDAALASIPGEAFQEGTKTRAQLHQKFTSMKGPLRELVLIPASGGGVFTHLLARLVANIKVSEQSPYVGNEGIESVIGHVENYLAEGKLAEAADILEKNAQGTKAEELAAEWARLARNRAIMEQALQLIQSHAVAIASSLS